MSRIRHRPPPPRPPAGRRVDRSRESVRDAAVAVVERLLASRAPAGAFLAGALERFDERDRGLLSELVLGTLRWLRRIDSVLEAASDRPVERIDPVLLAPLRIAVYQLLFLDRVPAHAAVNEAVAQARRLTHKGGASFVNAVLRRIGRSPRLADWPVGETDPVRRLGVEHSHPDFLVARWLERFGHERTVAVLEANNRPKPLHLLAFRDRGGRELAAEALIDDGVEVEPSRVSPLGLVVAGGDAIASAAFRRGDCYVQDEASQVAALVPPPRPGERVLDAAAAPGGKTFALLAYEPSVEPVLADVDPARAGDLAANLRRLGRRLPVVVADSVRSPLAATFDRVVLDLPCSGTGTLRKHPELKWRLSESEIGRLSRQALAMLRASAPRVAPGGLLVAITCSLEAEENERVVERFLDEPAGAGLVPLPLDDRLAPPLDRAIRGPGFWRLFPAGHHDGFTVHVLRRAEGPSGHGAAY